MKKARRTAHKQAAAAAKAHLPVGQTSEVRGGQALDRAGFSSRRFWLAGGVLVLATTVGLMAFANRWSQPENAPAAAASQATATSQAAVPALATVKPSGGTSTAPLPAQRQTGPRSLGELLATEPQELAQLDIALVNLLCAEGLPGSESLAIDHCLAQLDRWAALVQAETARHFYRFERDPANYQNSEAYYRMLMLITVMQQYCGVHYNMARVHDFDFTHSVDLFIHGMIPAPGQSGHETNGGTCISMPVLYTAIARRLGYPVRLVSTKGHLFCRWDALDHALPEWRDRLNIEGAGRGLNCYDDDHYKSWPYATSEQEIATHGYLESQSPEEELAGFLATRGHCLLDIGQGEAALDAYARAVKISPSNKLMAGFQREAAFALRRQIVERPAVPRPTGPQPVGPQFMVPQPAASRVAGMPTVGPRSGPRTVVPVSPANLPPGDGSPFRPTESFLPPAANYPAANHFDHQPTLPNMLP